MNAETEKGSKTEKGSNSLQIGLIVVAAILLLSIIGNIIYMSRSGRLADEKKELISEKETLQTEKTVLNESIEVKDGIIEERNEQLELLAEEHQQAIAEKDARIAQLRRRVSASADDLEEQKELNDELASLKENLTLELEELTEDYYNMEQEMDALAAAYEQLEEETREAAIMNAYNITALTKWDRWLCADRYNVSRARRTDQTMITFEVDGSIFTEPGTKNIHLLMYNPNDELMNPAADTFHAAEVMEEGTELREQEYTEMREIEYAHEPVMLEFDIIHEDRLQAGPYRIEVYIDGTLSRTKVFRLE